MRFNEFKQALEGIPPRTLALRLVELEDAGVLERRVLPDTRPPRVEYQLTPVGRRLGALVDAMRALRGARLSRKRHHSSMNGDAFLERLAEAFDDFPRSELPRDVRFAEILEAVPGLARANNLALLNAAASCLDAGECYVEVGTYHGTSLIAAMVDRRRRRLRARQLVARRRQPGTARGEPGALRPGGPSDPDRGRRIRDAPLRRARGPSRRRLLLRQRSRVRAAARRDAASSSRISSTRARDRRRHRLGAGRACGRRLSRRPAARDRDSRHRRQGSRPPGVVGGHACPPLVDDQLVDAPNRADAEPRPGYATGESAAISRCCASRPSACVSIWRTRSRVMPMRAADLLERLRLLLASSP